MKLNLQQAAHVYDRMYNRRSQLVEARECYARYLEYPGDKHVSINALLEQGDAYLTSIVLELTAEKLS